MADMRVVPPLHTPTLSEVVLCDHRNTLTLFSHFFKAAAAAEAATAAGSEASPERLMLKLGHPSPSSPACRCPAQAEEQVMYPALQAHCGPEGALLAEHAAREHRELSREVDSVLGILLEDHDRLLAGQPMPVAELLVKRRQLIKRMQELEQAFIAHQVEEEANVLPRLATALPAAPSPTHSAQEQRSMAVAFYHAKQKVELLRPGGTTGTGAAAGGSVMAVDTPAGA
ncbi:hypothetical protein COHA_010217 [Chlorella ohadii]|uniref:Uncharacterized protein n=1 Tax=Chlorella ohadii TaxID=2649997 RepID=A0AAD5H0S5_9CHLO|nr:hypothetical protein COHA_010217 [Chlorella ohadii]